MINDISIIVAKVNIQILIVGESNEFIDKIDKNKFDIFTITETSKIVDFCKQNKLDLVIVVAGEIFFNDVNQIEKLKKKEKYKNLPVIVIDRSPFTIPNNIKLAFQSGATDFIGGEINDFELESRIENQLRIYKRMAEIVEENSVNMETLELMDKLVLFMDRADNSFVIFDANGEIEWVNEGFNRLYGYSIDEFKRRFGRTIMEASKNSDIESKIDKCIKTKKSINYVSECQTRGGEFKWIQTTFTPVVSPNGVIERFIAIETDITKLKETEEALNQKNEYMLALTNHLKSANVLLEQQQKEINTQNKEIEIERKKSDELLLNILPFEVARQLKSKGVAKPKDYKMASVFFLDFVDFTKIAIELPSKDLVHVLDSYFKEFDDIIEKHFIEKIKTIGDAYMCVGGLPLRNRSNPFNVVMAGLEIQHFVNSQLNANITPAGLQWKCRIGIHTGPVIAGVVGRKKYLYDVWGNTVNVAARMQQESDIGRVNVSGETYAIIKEYFDCEYRGKIAVKNAGKADMYFVNRLKEQFCGDERGFVPNEEFQKILNSF
ncbi:MAG: PAS domain S-box protein [Salinivirgaceae bacterium]|nr:PAS domain S-box protein [Salinivirgaceae bacterium]